ncbi:MULTISPECIES: hypothetical protein [unclassified Pseudomonas]|uniref:hypothetical protein n=1 Tax=unclassified Pseudomonas TaxID=196821 RepID=UPI002113E537|nr:MULTISPECIES: hypothetical protein [unclassified Pseudomonas]
MMSLQQLRILKSIAIIVTPIYLSGCVGVVVSMPEKIAAYETTYDAPTTREWCGITLVAVVIPIPLKLPVCEVQPGQRFTSPFYACGPFMVLGNIVHGYEGYGLCGKFRQTN